MYLKLRKQQSFKQIEGDSYLSAGEKNESTSPVYKNKDLWVKISHKSKRRKVKKPEAFLKYIYWAGLCQTGIKTLKSSLEKLTYLTT